MKQNNKFDCALDTLSVIKLSVVSHQRIFFFFFSSFVLLLSKTKLINWRPSTNFYFNEYHLVEYISVAKRKIYYAFLINLNVPKEISLRYHSFFPKNATEMSHARGIVRGGQGG